MKFLKDVYFSTEYMHSEFQLLACVFWFFITFCSLYGMKWDRAYRPTNDPFWAFLSPGAQEPVHPQTVFVYFRQLKKFILGPSKKDKSQPPSTARLLNTSLQIWDQLGVTWQNKQRFFFAISGDSTFKHFKQLFMTLSGLGFLTMWELPRWVSYFVSSLFLR